MSEAKVARLPLACPYCRKVELRIEMGFDGRGYMSSEVAVAIECWNCDADWETNGTPKTAAKWVEYPDLYKPPPDLVESTEAVPNE